MIKSLRRSTAKNSPDVKQTRVRVRILRRSSRGSEILRQKIKATHGGKGSNKQPIHPICSSCSSLCDNILLRAALLEPEERNARCNLLRDLDGPEAKDGTHHRRAECEARLET
jgi:hypothetical protein